MGDWPKQGGQGRLEHDSVESVTEEEGREIGGSYVFVDAGSFRRFE